MLSDDIDLILRTARAVLWKATVEPLKFTYISPQAEELFGIRRQDWYNNAELWAQSIHPEDRERAVGTCSSAASNGEDHVLEYRVLKPDGKVLWVEDSVKMLKNGQAWEMVGVMVDTTARREAELRRFEQEQKSQRLLRGVWDAAREGVVVTQDGMVLHANPAAEAMLGFFPSTMAGKHLIDDLLLPEFKGMARDLLERLKREPGLVPRLQDKPQLRHFRRADGGTLKAEVFPAKLDPDQPDLLAIFIVDTEARDAAQAVVQAVFEAGHEAVLLCKADGTILNASPVFERMSGYPREEWQGRTFGELLLWEEDLAQHRKNLARMAATPLDAGYMQFTRNYRFKHSVVRCRAAVRKLPGAEGHLLCFIRDLTEEERAADAVLRSMKLFRTMVEKSLDLMVFLDEDGTIHFISPNVRALLGYEPHQLIGRPGWALLGQGADAGLQDLERLITEGKGQVRQAARLLRADGTWRRMEMAVQRMAESQPLTGILMQARDLEPELAAREAQERSDELFKSLIENSPDMTAVFTEGGLITYISPNCAELLGWSQRELMGRHAYDLMHPDELSASQQVLAKTLQGGKGRIQLRLRHKSERWVPFDCHGSFMAQIDGRGGVLVQCRSLEQQQAVQEALRTSELLYQSVVENSWDIVLIAGLDGRILQASPSALASFERPAEGLHGKPLGELVAAEDRARLQEQTKAVLSGRIASDFGVSLLLPAGPHRFEARVRLLEGEDKDLLLFKARNIQAEMDAQQQLMTYQRLAVFGQLAAGFAHEVRNPLATILGAAQLAQLKLQGGKDPAEQLQMVLRQAERLKALMEDILQHARSARVKPEPLDPCEPLKKALEAAQTQFGPGHEKVRVKVDCAPGKVKVLATEERLLRLLANLFLNSLQAMAPMGGEVDVRSRLEGAEAVIVVQDNGPGLSPGVLERMFEPFFTTKDTGSGLGLWIAQSLAQELGGSLNAEAVQPHGARFTLRLPAVEGA